MLHYCSVTDIQNAFPSTPRYDTVYQEYRDAITEDFNKYMRRDLAYDAAVVETITPLVRYRERFRHYLAKKTIVANTFVMRTSECRDWTNDDTIIDPSNYELFATLGYVDIYGPIRYPVHMTYSGGYADAGGSLMACPPDLRAAAITQALYRLRTAINQEQGHIQDRKVTVPNPVKLIGGMLPEVAATLNSYRKVIT